MRLAWRNSGSRFGAIALALHWLSVALVVSQFVLGHLAAPLPLGLEKLALIARHKSIGMTILLLTLARIAWRSYTPAPPLPASMPGYERRLAGLSHALLYATLLCLPVSGWLMSSAANFPVAYFGWFQFPDLLGPDKALVDPLKAVHQVLGWLLIGLVLVHVAAALQHHYVRRDGVLTRMLPGLWR